MVECTGDDHRRAFSYMVYHKTTLMLHSASVLVSSCCSDSSLARSEDMVDMDLHTFTTSGIVPGTANAPLNFELSKNSWKIYFLSKKFHSKMQNSGMKTPI